jgi:hypothetical protein
MLKATINNIDYEIIDGSINWELNAVSDFNITIIANEIDYRNVLYETVDIYYAGELLISGFVDKRPTIQIGDSKILTVNLQCVDNMGLLTCRRSYRNSHFQNTSFLAAITTLILSYPDWTLDTSTLTVQQSGEMITIDLREKETLFSQITELVALIPGVHMRYGGFNGTDHVLEIGVFNTVNTYADRNFNLLNINLEPQEKRYYKVVESYSGITENKKIRLNRAFTDARYLASPYLAQYPISQDVSDGAWIVTNTLAPSGVTCSIRKSFKSIKTKNDAVPTAAQKNDVSYALYLKSVRFLKESEPADLYTLRMTDVNIPRVGDRVHIHANIEEPVFNSLFGSVTGYVTTFTVNEDFRMTRLSLNLKDINETLQDQLPVEREFVFDITASSNDELGFYDAELELFEKLEEASEYNEE